MVYARAGELEENNKGERWVVNLVICACGQGFPIVTGTFVQIIKRLTRDL